MASDALGLRLRDAEIQCVQPRLVDVVGLLGSAEAADGVHLLDIISPRGIEGFGTPTPSVEAVCGFRAAWCYGYGYTPNCEALRSVWAATSAVK